MGTGDVDRRNLGPRDRADLEHLSTKLNISMRDFGVDEILTYYGAVLLSGGFRRH